MKHRNSVLGFIAAVSLTLRDGDAAHAQAQRIAQEVQTYAGDLFGDRLQTPGIVEAAVENRSGGSRQLR
jgi:hypothetical protein